MTDLRTDLEALADEWGIPLPETSASAIDAASDFAENIADSGAWRFVRDLQAVLAKHPAPTADRKASQRLDWLGITFEHGRPVSRRDGPCTCDYNPETTDGPDEFCPFHGRSYGEWVEWAERVEAPAADRHEVAEVIWTTSRADESTISATGANHVADALLARFEMRRKA